MRSIKLSMILAMCACGGSSPGSVDGTVHGMTVPIGDVISSSATGRGTAAGAHFAVIEMSTTSNLCADAVDPPIEHPSQQVVLLEMFDVNGTTLNTPTVPGTYAIFQGTGTPPAKSAVFAVKAIDAACKDIPTSDAKATTGTVTLASVSGNVFTGSFDVALDSGDHVTGSFEPEACPAIQAAIDSTATPTCR